MKRKLFYLLVVLTMLAGLVPGAAMEISQHVALAASTDDKIVGSWGQADVSTTGTGNVDLALLPTSQSVVINRSFNVDIQVQTNGDNITGVQAFLDFDPTKLQVTATAPATKWSGKTVSLFADENVFDNTLGQVAYGGGVTSDVSGNITLTTVTFQAVAAGSTNITFHFAPPPSRDTGVFNNMGDPVLRTAIGATVDVYSKPDLIISEKHEEWVVPGVSYRVFYTVSNNGTANASAGHDVYVTVDSKFIEQKAVSVELEPGATYSDSFTTVITMTGNNDGVGIGADFYKEVDELNESNNALSNTLAWPAAPNLGVRNISEEWVQPGSQYRVHYAVRNRGNAPAPAGHDTALIIDGVLMETRAVPVVLAPGEEYADVFSTTANLTGGVDRVVIITDVNNEVAESIESKLAGAGEWVVAWPSAPDLRVAALNSSIQWVGEQSGNYTVSFVLSNRGNTPAPAGYLAEINIDGAVIAIVPIPVVINAGEYIRVSFAAEATLSGNSDNITVTADINNEVSESDETNNSVTSVFSNQPDLIILEKHETWVTPGSQYTIGYTVMNNGSVPAPAGHDVALQVDGKYIEFRQVPAELAPGATWTDNFTTTTNLSGTTDMVVVTADYNNEVAESNETNNSSSFTVAWPAAPDLRALNISDEWVIDGSQYEVHFGINNGGNAPAPAGHLAALSIDGVEVERKPIPLSLAPGQTYNDVFNTTVNITGGMDRILVTADVSNVVAESNEGNQTQTTFFWPQAPDLIVFTKSEQWLPGSTTQYNVFFGIANKGNAPAPAGYDVELKVDGVVIETKPIPVTLNPGGTYSIGVSFSTNVTISGGSDNVTLTADINNEVAEGDETNNVRTNIWNALKPDLTIIEKHDEFTMPGDSYRVFYTIKNQGSATAPAGHDTALQIDGQYIEFKEVTVSLAPGETYTDSFIATTNLTSLDNVTIYTDYYNEVDESNEGNNRTGYTIAWPPTPDLRVNNSTDEWVVPGSQYKIRFVVRNDGNAPAPADHSAALFIDGVELERKQIPVSLVLGQSYSDVFSAIINLSGGMDKVTVTADISNNVTESYENNNSFTNTFAWPQAPDLIISNKWEYWLPGSTTQYNVFFSVQNIGNAQAPAGHDVELKVDGALIGMMSIPSTLNAGSMYSGSFSNNVTVSGESDNVTVTADINNEVAEGDENNNSRLNTWWAQTPLMPDLAIMDKHEEWIEQGVSYRVFFNVMNVGAAAAPSQSVGLNVNGVDIEHAFVGPLLPGENWSASFAATINLSQGGFDKVALQADVDNQINEPDEGNNWRWNIFSWPPKPLLNVYKWEEWVVQGQSYTIHYKVENMGNAPAPAGHDVLLEIDGIVRETRMIPVALNPGENYHDVFSYIGSLTDGIDSIAVTADINNEVVEAFEGWNTMYNTLSWPAKPDLVVRWKNEQWVQGQEGTQYKVNYSIQNIGNAMAPAGHVTRLLIDGMVTENQTLPVDLWPNQEYWQPFTSVITLSGSDNITVIADIDNQVDESIEGNNARTNFWPPPPPGANRVYATFSPDYDFNVSSDNFTNGQVTGNRRWISNLHNNIDASGQPIIGATLRLDTPLSFDWTKPIPVVSGPPSYQWFFGDMPETVDVFKTASVGFNLDPVTFVPGFDLARSASQTRFTSSGIQTLTVNVTPRQALTAFFVAVYVSEDTYVNPIITSPAANETQGILPSPDGRSLRIRIDNATIDQTYAFQFTINVVLKPGATSVDFMPTVHAYWSETPSSGSVAGVSTLSHTMDVGGASANWTWSATGNYDWSWREHITRSVFLNATSRLALPDLTIIEKHENWVVPGVSYTVGYTIKNQGSEIAPAGHDVALQVDGVIVEQKSVPVSLLPGANYTDTFTTIVNLSGTTDGVTVIADFNNEVAESNEGNNRSGYTVAWPPVPDLATNTPSDEWIVPGSQYRVRFGIRNQGNALAPAGHLAALTVDGVELERKAVPVSLAPGQSYSDVFNATVNITGGIDRAVITADITNLVTESNESPNHINYTIAWPPAPDLIINSKYEQWLPNSNTQYNVFFGVQNIGNAQAPTNHDVQLKVDGIVIGTASIPVIQNRGNIYNGAFSANITISGSSDNVTVTADINNEVTESDESNNVRWNTWNAAAKPDLVIVEKHEAWVQPWSRYIVDFTIKNNTGATVPAGHRAGLLVDGDLIEAKPIPVALASGANYTANFTTIVNLSGGSDSIIVFADINNEVDESNETNNSLLNIWTAPGGGTQVRINAPPFVSPAHGFTAVVGINQVQALDAANYDVSFNPAVLRLDDVTAGNINGITIPVDAWNQREPGRFTIVQNVPGLGGVSGNGSLAVLHFFVVGADGQSSNIGLSNGTLSSNQAEGIPATWLGDFVEVGIIPGDANGDGEVNAIDITKVERIIAHLDQPTPGADANGDGNINALDITKVERIIVGLDTGGTAASVPKYGGIVTAAINSAPSNFDSGINNSSGALLNTVYEQYMGTDWTRGPASNGVTNYAAGANSLEDNYGPQLSTNWSMPEPGVWILQVRQGVHWALNPMSEASRLVNGRELTADDIVHSLNRLLSSNTSWIAVGQPAIRAATTINQTGPWQVTIRTPVDYMTSFIWIIQGAGFNRVYPPEVVQAYGNLSDWHNAVGTGPFMLTNYVTGSVLEYVKNPNYWGTNPLGPGQGDQLPYLDGYRELIIPDAATRQAAFRTGMLDLLTGVSTVDSNSMMQTNPQLERNRYLANTPWAVQMRTDKQDLPFKDIRVRQALMLGTDFNAIKSYYYGGEAEIDVWPVNSQVSQMFTPLTDMPQTVKDLYVYNPNRAKQLLAEAGYPNGFKTVVVTDSASDHVDQLSILKDYWAKIGIDLTIDVKAAGPYSSIASARSHTNMLYRVTYGLYAQQLGFTPFRGSSFSNGSFVNDPPGADPYIESLYTAVNNAMFVDMPTAYAQYKLLKPYLLEKAFQITWPTPYTYNMWWPWLKNYYGQGTGFIRYAWLDQPLKQSMGY